MATRSLNVTITGDARGIGVAAREADGHLRVVQRSAKITGAAVKAGFGVAAGGALLGVAAIKKSVDAAKEAQTSQARLQAQLKASGISYTAHAKDIDAVIQKHSQLAGIDDEDLQDAFTNLVRSTGSVSKSMHDMGLVTDIARAKHIDVTKAADLLGKVHAGNTAVLKRYGIAFDPVTKAQDKLKESNKNATAEQVKAAKAADKQATSQKALAELQRRFGGQAEAYGKTAAGAQERFGVAIENVEEKIGGKLLPVLTKVVGGVATFVAQMDSGKGAGGRFASAVSDGFGKVKQVISTVVNAVRGYLAKHRQDIADVVAAFKRVADFAKQTWQETLLPMIRRTVAAIGPILQGLADVIRGIVRTISGLLSGNWSKAWDGAKEAVGGAVKVTVGLVKTMSQNLWQLIKDLGPKLMKALGQGALNVGKAIGSGILQGLGNLGHIILQKLRDAVGWVGKNLGNLGSSIGHALNPFGDGIGPTGGGSIPGIGGGGSLMGADPDLAPFANLASSMGLHTSSGLRVGAHTLSGNVSYHSSGDAIDEVGPFSAMKQYASTLFHRSGARLRELISPWPQFNIKDGHPFRYPANIEAQHSGSNAHVHVAYTGPFGDGQGRSQGASASRLRGFAGFAAWARKHHVPRQLGTGGWFLALDEYARAIGASVKQIERDHGAAATDPDRWKYRWTGGQGDGLGRFTATSYGPPWGGIQGTGVTATGVNLKGNPHTYGVAVDPSVIPLGTKLKITPNPFGYGGTFTAFDTGGAIKGKRIDFYDWRGRKAQLGWGSKTVTVSTVDSPGSTKTAKIKHGSSTVHGTGPYDPTVLYPDPADPSDDQTALTAFVNARRPVKGIRTGGPVKGLSTSQIAAAATGDPNQPLIDAITENTRVNQERIDQEAVLAANQLKIIALAGQGDQIVNAVVAAANGGIGRNVGLSLAGLKSPPGSVMRT